MDCIFCKIVNGDIPSQKVFENDRVLAFRDIQPAAPTHVLVIPKKHIASMNEAQDEDAELLGELLLTAKKVAAELGIAESGYRLVNNVGPNGGQVVYHIHVHILGGEKLGGLNVKA
ncbi:histidine triad nucleotide-binding protein [Paenibacillus flagellatus]|uniref:Histidine triad nucleotide-binding protein n=1 Tax=Paenibacillus flagellatus TaxID=2211139 RepID=A0A2V5JY73_9BACL|nr:histidine triad nucleotide-binding protein [Paenibacillus flagellatus]PYI51768.1 histidine triad nucleotide-binding protein [Paenibacillus flagellatus]